MNRQQLEQKIISLRRRGYKLREIAAQLRTPQSTVSHCASRLIRLGKLKRDPRGSGNAKPLDLNHPRAQTIINLSKQRMSVADIGRKLGVTRERARQLINEMKDKFGSSVLEAPLSERLWDTKECAAKAGVPRKLVTYLCQTGKIPILRREAHGNRRYLMDANGLAKLERYVKQGACIVCGKPFQKISPGQRVCSNACAGKRKVELRTARQMQRTNSR